MDASKSYDDDGDILKYEWNFGDSTFGSGMTVNKNYSIPGLYTVGLTVYDNSGLECNKSYDTKVIKVIESPVAFAGEDIQTCSNIPVVFNAYKSTDSDGIVNSFEWDFGDGKKGGGEKTSHVYKKAGVYTVVLTITGELTGDCDNVDTDELIVVVEEAPLAEFNSTDSVAVNEEIVFDGLLSDGKGSVISDYLWTFGDGNSGEGKKLKHKYSINHFEIPYPTLNLGNIHGGDNANRICGCCEMHIDMRPLPGLSVQELQALVLDATKEINQQYPNAVSVIDLHEPIPAFSGSTDSALVKMAEKIAGQKAVAVNYCTEAPFIQQLGCETIVMGPGSINQAHQPDEFLAMEKIKPSQEMIKQLIVASCF